jgi:hypothetical protein
MLLESQSFGMDQVLFDAADLLKEHIKEGMYRNRNLLSSTY